MKLIALTIDNPTDGGSISVQTPQGVPTGSLLGEGRTYLHSGITLFLIGAALLALFFFIWGGIGWITSGGDKTKLQNARNKMIYSIIGLIVAFLAFFIVTLIGTLFGVELLKSA